MMSENTGYDMSMFFHQKVEMRQKLLMDEIMSFQDEPGLEVFFNIEGLPEFTAEIFQHILENIGKTTIAGFVGPSGFGKSSAALGLLHVATHSKILNNIIKSQDSALRPMVTTLADRIKRSIYVEREIEAEWNHFDQEHFQMTSEDTMRDIQWAIRTAPSNGSETRLVINDFVAVQDHDPAHPENVLYLPYDLDKPGERTALPKFDLGGSVFQKMARSKKLFLFGVAGDGKVEALAMEGRREVEEIDINHPALKKLGIVLDKPIRAWDLYTMSGNEYGMLRMHEALDELMIAYQAAEHFTHFRVTRESLLDLYLRKEIILDFMRTLFRKWGVENCAVGSNDVLVNEEGELIDRKQLFKLKEQYQFPYQEVTSKDSDESGSKEKDLDED